MAWTEGLGLKLIFLQNDACRRRSVWISSGRLGIMGRRGPKYLSTHWVCRWAHQMIIMLLYQELGEKLSARIGKKTLSCNFWNPFQLLTKIFLLSQNKPRNGKKQLPRVAERDVREKRTKKALQHGTGKALSKIMNLNSLPRWLKKQRMRLSGSGGHSLNVLLIAFIL